MTSRKQLNPRDIRFTQNSISSKFLDGRLLSNTFSELLNGKITPDNIEDIEVVLYNDAWRAITGNRRLYLYRQLQELGVVSMIWVRVRDILSEQWVLNQLNDPKRYTTNCDGVKIGFRQSHAHAYADINRIIEQWRMETGNRIQPMYGFEVGHGFNSTGFIAPPNQSYNLNEHHQRTTFRNQIGYEMPSQLPSSEVANNEVPSSNFTNYNQRPDSKTSRRSVPASRPGTGTGNIFHMPSIELTNQIQRPGSQTSRRSATYGNAVHPLPNPVAGQLPVSNEPDDGQTSDLVSQKKSFSLLRFSCCSVSK